MVLLIVKSFWSQKYCSRAPKEIFAYIIDGFAARMHRVYFAGARRTLTLWIERAYFSHPFHPCRAR